MRVKNNTTEAVFLVFPENHAPEGVFFEIVYA